MINIINNIKNKMTKLYQRYFGFFLLAIVLTWGKTYISYHLDFSLGVKGLLQNLILLINPIAMTALLFSICLFRKKQNQSYITLMIIYILNSILLYANILYYREFSDFLTLNIITEARHISEGSIVSGVSNILPLLKWYDFVYWTDLVFLIVLIKKDSSSLIIKDRKALFSSRNGFKAVAISLVLLFINIGLAEISRPELLTRTFDRSYIVKYLGINGFTAYDSIQAVATITQNVPPSDDDIKEVLDYTEGRHAKPSSETFGIAKDRNVIAIHLESIEQFLIDYKLIDEENNEWEVLPFLNQLYHSEDTLSFPNFFAQTGQGKSSDAELMMECSLFGLSRGAAFIKHAGNEYHSFVKVLKEKAGYTSAAFHGNVGSFWNRADMYKSLEYEYFFDADDFVLTEENTAEYGLKDKLFFMQSSKYIEQLQQPFYAKFLTLSNHFPFPYDESNSDIPKADTHDETINGYFASSNYADQALEEFFNYLKETEIYENSVFVLYGDHYGISNARKKSLAPLLDRDSETWTTFDNLQTQRVPLIIHIPGYGKGSHVETYGGQIDIMPTMLHLLGIDTESLVLLGQDLLSPEKSETLVFRNGNTITPYYSIIGEHVYNTNTGEIIPETDISTHNIAEMLKEEANEQLRISDKIHQSNLLAYYRPSGLAPVDTHNIDYLNDWDRLMEEAEKAGENNTSIYYKNGNVSTTHLYKTDAPEFEATLRAIAEAEMDTTIDRDNDSLNY